jgi:putative ATPase
VDIFDHSDKKRRERHAPLADRMRPRSLEEFVGQTEILGPGKLLRASIEHDEIVSMIFWGPPGSGKTTLARIIAELSRSTFVSFSAVTSGIKEVREVIEQAKKDLKYYGKKTILFVDEIHRFNKAQQDVFLPYVEDGTIVLIGATTENPSFEVNSALLSRTRVYVFGQLTEEDLAAIIRRAAADPDRGLGSRPVAVDEDALGHLASQSHGDARIALSGLEIAVSNTPPGPDGTIRVTLGVVEEAMQRRALMYDKGGEEHYNIISALHKSVRDSDPDAALYWLSRMLEGGEDPLYVARRLIRMAIEDVGMADPRALSVAVAAKDAYHFMGYPEGELALAEAAVYLACAPKSNAVYTAFGSASKDVKKYGALPVPLVIRNAPTRLMKEVGYGKGYKYAHDYPDAVVDQERLPAKLAGRVYYHPTDRGFEEEVKRRLGALRAKQERTLKVKDTP